eukprot:4678017-Amphidinium_carterae.1
MAFGRSLGELESLFLALPSFLAWCFTLFALAFHSWLLVRLVRNVDHGSRLFNRWYAAIPDREGMDIGGPEYEYDGASVPKGMALNKVLYST